MNDNRNQRQCMHNTNVCTKDRKLNLYETLSVITQFR